VKKGNRQVTQAMFTPNATAAGQISTKSSRVDSFSATASPPPLGPATAPKPSEVSEEPGLSLLPGLRSAWPATSAAEVSHIVAGQIPVMKGLRGPLTTRLCHAELVQEIWDIAMRSSHSPLTFRSWGGIAKGG